MQKAIKQIVSFSGGAASFAAAVELIWKYPKEDILLVFCDTLIEDEDLYRFIDEAAEKLGLPLIKLCKGETPWEVFERKKYQGNSRIAHCTTELKGKMFAEWLSKNYKPDECVIHFGFHYSELDRLETARYNWQPYKCEAPLCWRPIKPYSYTMQVIEQHGIKIPRLYEMGFTHNNCGGFCVKAGQAHFANLLETMPERYKFHEEKQEELMLKVPNVRPFLRMTVNGKLEYITLRQYREYLQAGKSYNVNETGGCNCFSDTSAKGIEQILKLE